MICRCICKLSVFRVVSILQRVSVVVSFPVHFICLFFFFFLPSLLSFVSSCCAGFYNAFRKRWAFSIKGFNGDESFGRYRMYYDTAKPFSDIRYTASDAVNWTSTDNLDQPWIGNPDKHGPGAFPGIMEE